MLQNLVRNVNFKLKFCYQTQICRQFPVTKLQLARLADLLAITLPLSLLGTVNINIVNAKRMAEIADEYYPFKQQASDVLSFRYKAYNQVKTSTCLLGEVFISWPQTKIQAQKLQHSLKRESTYLLIHGLLHLFGYDHHNQLDQTMMRYWEEFFLAQKGVKDPE